MVSPRTNDRVAVVVYDRMTTLEFAIPTEVFGLARPDLDRFYSMQTVAAEDGPLRAAFGLVAEPGGGLADLVEAGTVIVPGWRDRFETPPRPLLDALVEAHRRGARLVSICSGAFVLAETGLLDGQSATTHWAYVEDLRARFPAIEVDPDVLFVDNGSIITSAGSAAGIDTCLHLVREDWGAGAANTVARRLVVSPQRSGGQAQHVERTDPVTENIDFAELLAGLDARLAERHTVASMAAEVHLSGRTFQRRFAQAVGVTPGAWLVERRVARARELLEQSDLSVERVAHEVGFGAAVSLRHHFRLRLHTTPTAYRSAYRQPVG